MTNLSSFGLECRASPATLCVGCPIFFCKVFTYRKCCLGRKCCPSHWPRVSRSCKQRRFGSIQSKRLRNYVIGLALTHLSTCLHTPSWRAPRVHWGFATTQPCREWCDGYLRHTCPTRLSSSSGWMRILTLPYNTLSPCRGITEQPRPQDGRTNDKNTFCE